MILGTNTKMGMNGSNLEWNRTAPRTDTDAQFLMMAKAGVKILRIPFYMYLTQFTQGVYTLDTMDYIVDKALSYDIQILALMAFHESTNWSNGGHGNESGWPVLPNYYADWISYIGTHYGSKINYFELGNEPDVTGFWLPAVNIPAYTAAMITGYQALKAVRPDATLLSAGFTGISPRTTDGVNAIYDNGGKDYFDALGLHLYVGGTTNGPPNFDMVDQCRAIMDENGDTDKPIIITEIGYYTGTATGARSELVQADYVKQLYDKIITGEYQEIPFLCWFDIKDMGTTLSNSENNYGLIHHENYLYPYQPKPSWYRYQQIAGLGPLMPTFFTDYSADLFDFYDNFNRANGALGTLLTGQSWYSPKFAISSNTAKNTPTLGSNIVTNGDFSSDTSGWLADNATLSSVGGGDSGNCLQVTNVGANKGFAYQILTTEIGQYYRVDLKYKNGTSVSRHRAGITTTNNSYFERSSASSSGWTGRAYYFRAETTTTYLVLGTDTAVDGATEFYDTVICQKVTLNEILATVSSTLTDIDISINNTSVQWTNNGFIVNLDSVSNPQNFVLATENQNTGFLKLEKCVNGIFSLIYQATHTSTTGGKFQLVKIGTSYQFYYNGVAKGLPQTISDPEIVNNTIHGLWLPDNQSSFDNFILNNSN